MTYYFSLHNLNVKDFWSDKTIFGGAVVLIAPDESRMLFKCDFVHKRDKEDCSVFKIELELNDLNKYVHNDHLRIKLANMTGNSNSRSVTWTSLHNSDDFGGNVEEPYHYYHFAVTLKEKLILTSGSHKPVRSIRIRDILSNDRKTVKLPVCGERLMCKPDGTIFYKYSVRLPDKYLESFLIGRESFRKILYLSDSAMYYSIFNKNTVVVTMYRSINGLEGLKDSMGLEICRPKLKPWDWITTKPECNITIDIPKDFIPPYFVADSRISMLEVFKEMNIYEPYNRVKIPEIKEVIFNGPATVVYWTDGDKTRVKCGKNESYDREKAVAMCLIKKMLKPSKKCHWLDVIHDAIQAADDKVAKIAADKEEKARIKAENIAKAEEARRKKAAANKIEEIQKEVNKLDEEIKENPPEPLEEILEEKESSKFVKKNKIDQDLMLECIKEKLTIDEIAEMNSWDKAAVARMYYKITGTKPEKKPNTYSELDTLFEQGVSVDAAARRTGFSKNIVAMRYAKLQNKKDKE